MPPTKSLRDVLLHIASTYDRHQGTKEGVLTQDYLRALDEKMLPLPAGFRASGNGGKGTAALTPWIGVFDPDISAKSQEGLYLAYIFAADLRSVSLTLQQGVEGLMEQLQSKGESLRSRLEHNTQRLQELIELDSFAEWRNPLDLRLAAKDLRPRAYEAGSIASKRYVVPGLPSERELREDLWTAAEILQYAAGIEQSLWYSDEPGQIQVEYQPAKSHKRREELDSFRPKDDSDYVAHIPARTQRKTRRHETLIREFAEYAESRGLVPSTPHPKDLVLKSSEEQWLVEAKVVTSANPTRAVREAVAQLFEYRHFLCPVDGKPHMMALFTETVHVYVDYLETLGIGSVWKTPQGWAGSASAVKWGLIDSTTT